MLFDENLPWRVAAALRALDFSVSYVGDDAASPASPDRGSSDEVVLNHATAANQVVVTSNLDMILLCAERRQQVIWIDPRGRQLRLEELVLLVFQNVADWVERFNAAVGPVCLRAMRTKTETIELAEAGCRARNRMIRISQKRARAQRSPPPGELFPDL